MADTPIKIQDCPTEIAGLLPIPANGYKVPIGNSSVNSGNAQILDLSKMYGGLSSKRTVEEIYPITGWNMQTMPKLNTNISALNIATTPGTIIALQMLSIIDDNGCIHDAHGMYDQSFCEVPFVHTIVDFYASIIAIDGRNRDSKSALSGMEGKSLSVRVFYNPSDGFISFCHNYATNAYQTEGACQWTASQAGVFATPLNAPVSPETALSTHSVTPASAANLLSGTVPIAIDGSSNSIAIAMQACYTTRLAAFSNGTNLRGYLKVTRLIA
jgi:hypothetical protein